ncbi:ATP-binding protein, partial [Streptomyces sp. NPDC059680]|uniref:ATP-binding protein n=1 Tax=Streptomyces sp. NPDC059680 TaxID=3346904 RepID=UPI0036CD5BE1
KAENVILLGPPGIGKTHLAIGLGVKAAHAGHSVLFDTASNWITRLATAHQAGRLEAELKKIRRYRLIIIDEVGYIPFDQDAANLFFQLIASRYEQGSVMVTSNLPFGKAHMFRRTRARRRRNITGSSCGSPGTRRRRCPG